VRSDRHLPKNLAILFTRCLYGITVRVCETELLKQQRSSTVTVFSFILVYHSYSRVKFSSSSARNLPTTQHHRVERVPALQHFIASSSFLGTLTASSGRKCLLYLLCINIARINTREVIESASSLSHFLKLRASVI